MTNNQMMTKEGVSIDCNSDQKTTSHNNVNNIAAAIHMPFVHNAAIHVSGIENEQLQDESMNLRNTRTLGSALIKAESEKDQKRGSGAPPLVNQV